MRSRAARQLVRLSRPATLKRLKADNGFKKPIVLCNNDHRFLVKAELDGARIETQSIFLEPIARNTAPAPTETSASR